PAGRGRGRQACVRAWLPAGAALSGACGRRRRHTAAVPPDQTNPRSSQAGLHRPRPAGRGGLRSRRQGHQARRGQAGRAAPARLPYVARAADDKRRINDGLEEVHWLAALKPTTIGVPEFRDSARDYLEIAVLSAVLRVGAQAARLAELIHRAVPYPVLLIASQG